MRPLNLLPLACLLQLAPPASATFRDEVGHTDFHHALLGLPLPDATFFHRPRRADKASLLYTLSDVGVLGAVNPATGAIVWRQLLGDDPAPVGGDENSGDDGLVLPTGFLRAGEGEDWVVAAQGGGVHAWNALTGRNVWKMDFAGEVRDLEMMEMTEGDRKDVLVLFREPGALVARRLCGDDGRVVWEHRDRGSDVPLQISTDTAKVFVVSLHGASASYGIKVSVVDTMTGQRVEEIVISAKGDIRAPADVMFVGANSAAPIVAWTDRGRTTVHVNILGTQAVRDFALPAGTLSVSVHAPHHLQAEPHFLVHARARERNSATVYHTSLVRSEITKSHDLPQMPGPGAFSVSSDGANVYFTRTTEDEVVLTASSSHGILARWPLKSAGKGTVVSAASEVARRGDGSWAARSAATTSMDEWVMIRGGEVDWVRPEGMTGAVAAAWAEIPEGEELARILEQEAHTNPLAAYVHRVQRHLNDLEHLPDYLAGIPQRLVNSILGTELGKAREGLHRDVFGFNKLVILATRRGMVYGLDAGKAGKLLWSTRAFGLKEGEAWDVKGMYVEDAKARVTIRGSRGESIMVQTDSGRVIETVAPGSLPPVQSTAVVDSAAGKWLFSVGVEGRIDDAAIAMERRPKQTVVVRGAGDELLGIIYPESGFFESESESESESDKAMAKGTVAWTFRPPKGQEIVTTAARPPHDPVASIGRVLGDRRVKYKYLNANTLVVAATDTVTRSTLTTYLLDTISGQVLTSATHRGVDTTKPISCVMSENWFSCAYFAQYSLSSGTGQSVRGYHITVSDLYESVDPNDRGPLGAATNYSSLAPLADPTATGGPPLPHVVSQSYLLSAPVVLMAVTSTRQGIATRQVLAHLPAQHAVAALPRSFLEPRRPVGRDPTPAEVEAEGMVRYAPAIEIDPRSIVTHERDVLGLRGLRTSPTGVESSCLVIGWGVDVWGARVAPSMVFDILGKGFNKLSMLATVAALAGGVVFVRPMVGRKQINSRWKAQS